MGKGRRTHGDRGGFKRSGYNRGGFVRGGSRGGFRGNWNAGNRDRVNNEYHQRFSVPDSPGKRLSEQEIGVTEYMSNHEGFNGIIKSRFSDFQVSEVNILGEVAKLTDVSPPQPEIEEVTEDEDLLLTKYNVEILPLDTWDRINKVSIGDSDVQSVEIDVTTASKEERTKIHDAVKKAFGDSIVGSTINVDSNKTIRFVKYKKGVRIDNRVKWTWGGEFVHFVVHKEHCDTMEAAGRLADRMRMVIKPSSVGYAGTKDRRAKTSQWFSLKKVDPRKIAAACKDLYNITIGNYCFKDYGLRLGLLKGNQFRIALRNVTADDSVVAEACEKVAKCGFINYYGLQRFGTRHDLPTHQIGRFLLQGKYKEAIDCILSPRGGPLHAALAARTTHGPHAALQLLPRHCGAHEGKLLQALADKPQDLQTALFKVPRNTRLLYLHAYQSLIWNKVVSERIRKFGLNPVVGDLVPLTSLVEDDPDDYESDDESDETVEKNTTEKTNIPETEVTSKKQAKTQEEKITPVKELTQEDIDSGKYTIFDVVMPLPGYLIQYPSILKDYYETLLKEDNLTLTLKKKNKNYSMSGAYRRVAIRPEHMHWESVRYSDPYGDLLLSDLDEMHGRTDTAALPDGAYKAVLVSLTLPSSCYATMALRELLKVDTSSMSQASQNNYHKRKFTDETENSGGKKTKDLSEEDTSSHEEVEDNNKKERIQGSSDEKVTENSGELGGR